MFGPFSHHYNQGLWLLFGNDGGGFERPDALKPEAKAEGGLGRSGFVGRT